MASCSSTDRKPWTGPALVYAAALILSVGTLFFALELRHADLMVPFSYSGDGILIDTLVKGVAERGWYWHNENLGVPTGLDLRDFPVTDNLHFLMIKGISLLFPDYAVALNLYFLAAFPMIAVIALFVFRRLSLSLGSSLVASLLFTYLPYHLCRGEGHLFLGAYFMVPLSILPAFWMASGDPPFVPTEPPEGRHRSGISDFRSWFSLLTAFLLGVSGAYYAFFSCFFAFIGGLYGSIFKRSWRAILASLLFVSVVFISLLIDVSPSLFHQYRHGSNPLVAKRLFWESEIYGLKITQLLLPTAGHRIGRLAALKSEYDRSAPFLSENLCSSLGTVGSLGFLALLGCALFGVSPRAAGHTLFRTSGVLALAGTLFGTMAGFGALFAMLVTPQIRCYNRISVHIAFFSLLGFFALLDLFLNRLERTRGSHLRRPMLGLILLLGLLDQISPGFVPPYSVLKTLYSRDREFVRSIEERLPRGSMVFQLPYVPFPEPAPRFQMKAYSHFRGYLHSDELRWSYGAMKGRGGDLWQKWVSDMPLPEFIETLCFSGFYGIYVDRDAYEDRAVDLEAKLAAILGTPPLDNSDNTLFFFDMSPYIGKIQQRLTETDWATLQDRALGTPLLSWYGGFSSLEGTPQANWRWCSSTGELHIHNISQVEREITLEMDLATGYEQLSDLSVRGPLFSKTLRINSTPQSFSITLKAPPGKSVVEFRSNARRVVAPADQRVLMFRVINFRANGTVVQPQVSRAHPEVPAVYPPPGFCATVGGPC
jgi:phosphoglycerol transferase